MLPAAAQSATKSASRSAGPAGLAAWRSKDPEPDLPGCEASAGVHEVIELPNLQSVFGAHALKPCLAEQAENCHVRHNSQSRAARDSAAAITSNIWLLETASKVSAAAINLVA